jgi:hypothetical protein
VLAASIIRAVITLMKEAASTSETSVNFYQATQRYNPEDSHLRTCHSKNLKSCWHMLIDYMTLSYLQAVPVVASEYPKCEHEFFISGPCVHY